MNNINVDIVLSLFVGTSRTYLLNSIFGCALMNFIYRKHGESRDSRSRFVAIGDLLRLMLTGLRSLWADRGENISTSDRSLRP